MSHRRRTAPRATPSAARPAERPRATRARRPRRWPAAAAIAGTLAVIALVVLAVRPWDRRGGRAPRSAREAIPDSIARLGPDSAYQRGARLVNADRPDLSLPYFRHALTFPGDPAMAHVDYSSGLNNAAIQSRSRFGLMGMATRSSVERITLMREALAQLDIAERMPTTPAERARIHGTRAHHYVIWGMPWEALREFHEAQADEPAGNWIAVAAELAGRLHHPERPDPTAGPLEGNRLTVRSATSRAGGITPGPHGTRPAQR